MKYASETVLFFPMEPPLMKTHSEPRLIELAKTSPAFQQHVCDEWFRRYRTESQVYSEHQLRQLAEWLVRFANVPAPQIQKEVTAMKTEITYKAADKPAAKAEAKKPVRKKRKSQTALQLEAAEKNLADRKAGNKPDVQIFC
jgi:hypothetical protein